MLVVEEKGKVKKERDGTNARTNERTDGGGVHSPRRRRRGGSRVNSIREKKDDDDADDYADDYEEADGNGA